MVTTQVLYGGFFFITRITSLFSPNVSVGVWMYIFAQFWCEISISDSSSELSETCLWLL